MIPADVEAQPHAANPPAVVTTTPGALAGGPASRSQVSNKDDVNPKPYVYGPPIADTGNLANVPQFRFWAFPGQGGEKRLIDLEGASWNDQNVIMTGSITMRESAYIAYRQQYRLQEGDQVMCESRSSVTGTWDELWTMRVTQPMLTVSTLQRTAKLANDMDLLRRSDGTFHYGKLSDPSPLAGNTKKIKGGYPLDAMIRDICDRFSIRVSITSGLLKWKVQSFHMPATAGVGASPLDAIRYGLLQERQNIGTRTVMRYERGTLYILPLQRSEELRALGSSLLDAVYTSTLSEDFASEVIVRGTQMASPAVDKPKKRKKAQPQKNYVVRSSGSSVSRYGYIHKQYWSPDAETEGDLAEEAMQLLAWLAKPRKDLQLTLPGIPGIRRGDAIQVWIGEDGLWQQIVYVTEINHDLRPGMYQQTLTVTFDDPYIDQQGHDILWRLKASEDEAEAQRKADEQRQYQAESPKADQQPSTFFQGVGADQSSGTTDMSSGFFFSGQ